MLVKPILIIYTVITVIHAKHLSLLHRFIIREHPYKSIEWFTAAYSNWWLYQIVIISV